MGNADPSRKSNRLNSPESARGHRLFLALSLSLNLGLILFLVFVCRTPSPELASAIQFTTNTLQESRRSIIRKDSRPVAAVAASVSQWSQLESPDLAVYAANLRAAGCPEKTLRDILLPLVEEEFDYAKQPVPEPTNFWASFSHRQTAETARAEKEAALGEQREKMLKDLLGFAWTAEGLKHAYEGEAAIFFGFLDYEHAEKLLCIAYRFENRLSRANGLNQRDRRLAEYNALRREVADVLSPVEFEETELRGIMMMSHLLRNPDVFKAGLSGSELRQLMALQRDLCNPIQWAAVEGPNMFFENRHLPCEQQFNAKARLLLGDSRFIGYLQHCDSSVERTLEVLEKEHLPRSLAVRLFDIRQNAIAQALQIRHVSARRAEKRAHLAAVRQSALEQIIALSNSETNSRLIEINEDWLQEIVNP